MTPILPRIALAALALGVIAAAPLAALACGGCFSPPGPNLVVQDAERILYVRDPATKKSTLTVEIRYSGPAETFAWVLPLPRQPKIGVSSSFVFDRLDQATAPRFTTTRSFESEGCSFDGGGGGCNADVSSQDRAGAGVPLSAGGATGKDGGVVVLETSAVGPYETVTFKGEDGQKLLDWLNERGFETPQSAKPILDSHAEKGDVFVAVKLVSGADVAEIRPIVLEMDDADPCVPLRLTSIAAAEELAVVLYTLGPGRAVPKNHLHVQVNPLRLRWDGGVQNYAQVLAAAIDEAAGRAFATEFAGPASAVKVPDVAGAFGADSTALFAKPVTSENGGSVGEDLGGSLPSNLSIWRSGVLFDASRFQLGTLAEQSTAGGVAAWVRSSKFAVFAEVARALEKATGLAAANDRDDVLAFWLDVRSGAAEPAKGTEVGVDAAALADDLRVGIVEPIFDVAVALAGGGTTLTRLQLRISADEMDRDPIFGFNATLDEVRTDWRVELNEVCSVDGQVPDAVRLRMVQGPIAGGGWIIGGADFDFSANSQNQRSTTLTLSTATDARWKDAPAALHVELLDEQGGPVAIASADVALVDTAIAGALPGEPSLPATLTLKPAAAWAAPASDPHASLRHDVDAAHVDDGCSRGPAGRRRDAAAALLACALGALLVARARRRSAR